MSSTSRATSVCVGVAAALAISGCGQPTRDELRRAAGSATPPQATVLLRKDAECVEGARFPSCVEVFFRLGHRAISERLNLFMSNARQHGWKTQRAGEGGGEVFVNITQGRFKGTAGFWLDRYYRPDGPCNPLGRTAGGRVPTCADGLSVQWKR